MVNYWPYLMTQNNAVLGYNLVHNLFTHLITFGCNPIMWFSYISVQMSNWNLHPTTTLVERLISKQEQSEGLQSLADRKSHVYIPAILLIFNRGFERGPRAILETIGHRPKCQIQKLFILISPTFWHQSRLCTTIRLRDMTEIVDLSVTYDLDRWPKILK